MKDTQSSTYFIASTGRRKVSLSSLLAPSFNCFTTMVVFFWPGRSFLASPWYTLEEVKKELKNKGGKMNSYLVAIHTSTHVTHTIAHTHTHTSTHTHTHTHTHLSKVSSSKLFAHFDLFPGEVHWDLCLLLSQSRKDILCTRFTTRCPEVGL